MKKVTTTKIIERNAEGKVIKETETTVTEENNYPVYPNYPTPQPYTYPTYPTVSPKVWYGDSLAPNPYTPIGNY